MGGLFKFPGNSTILLFLILQSLFINLGKLLSFSTLVFLYLKEVIKFKDMV